ncbi:hypothetical protein CcaverHIS631_0107440 [Cutaneotrichosporon cavernicola]|nr:hypothetical protein CcaverHIS631_0107440 [Cutaneotrichosporon cavernicola]BEJ03568.1 hypothetical protein CcaverHIS641_0107430 [Cutaneotrichosporon cavernicola]
MTRPQARGRQPPREPTREFEAMHVDWRDARRSTWSSAPFQATYGAVYDEDDGPYQQDRSYQNRTTGGVNQPDQFDDRDGDWSRHNDGMNNGGQSNSNYNRRDRFSEGHAAEDRTKQAYSGSRHTAYKTTSYSSYQSDRPGPPTSQSPPSRGFSNRATPPGLVGKFRSHRNEYPRSSRTRDTFQLKPPRPLYIAYSCERYTTSGPAVPKLLVLDLNGALVYRNERGSTSRTAYPRPFLANFLSYLFGNDPDGRGYEVLVWSSAQPHNVRNMVESTFEPDLYRGVWKTEPHEEKEGSEEEGSEREGSEARGEGRLLNVWARDKMGLSQAAYRQKVQTVKDLRKVTDEFKAYDEKTTVLLDDSPLKAMHQPWSQVIIPEYDRPEFTKARSAADHLWSTTTDIGVTPTTADGSEEPGMDNILLGVIGILEALRGVDNVPGWVRAGHINTPEMIAEHPSHTITLADLPSDEGFVPWFKDAAAHAYWVKRGKEALARRRIPVTHGLMRDGHGATPKRLEAYKDAQDRSGAGVEGRGRMQRSRDRQPIDTCQPPIVPSDVEVAELPDQTEDATKTRDKGKQNKSKKREQRKGQKVQADMEAANADPRKLREDSVLSVSDEPRDDLPPGSVPSPFFVTSSGTNTPNSDGRRYATWATQPSRPPEASASQDQAPRTLSPSPERDERAYSPSLPVDRLG